MKRRSSEVEAALARIDSESLRRERRTIEAFVEPDSRVTVRANGRQLLDFSSND